MTDDKLRECREIPLTRGYVAIVDAEDYEFLLQWKWQCNNSGYAIRSVNNRQEKAHYFMHRVLTNCPIDKQVDHINGNRLDNRKCNLRICTHKENARARRKTWESSSRYKGVKKHKHRWRANIAVDGKYLSLGLYDNEKDAAVAYNMASLRHYREFAILNEV